MRKTIIYAVLAVVALVMFFMWATTRTTATFTYDGYSCWIECGMKPHKAFALKGVNSNIVTGQLLVLDMTTGEFIKPSSKWSLGKYFD